MIRASEALRKKKARQREAAKRAKCLDEAMEMLHTALGDQLVVFSALFDSVDPHKLRDRVREIADQLPMPPEEEQPPDLTAVAERLRAAHRAVPHPSGFVIGRR
jgi:hypothetical protein